MVPLFSPLAGTRAGGGSRDAFFATPEKIRRRGRAPFRIACLLLSLGALCVPSAARCSTLWGNTAPATPAFSDSHAYEIGVKFYSDVPGFITGIRFYKGPGNTGTHVAHLWDSSGHLLSSATFTSETSSGWQQVNLATPVAIKANTIYVASYWDPYGHYALNRPYFTTQYNNPPLHSPASGTYGPNAVFRYGSSGFPTETYDSSNYWVDVVFTPASTSTLWGNTSPATAAFSDSRAYEIGVKFYSDVAGSITGIRFYKGPGNTGTHIAHLWDSSGHLLSSATFTSETSSGWQQVNLATPVAIKANTIYVASYWDPYGHYALNRPYFTAQYNNSPLHSPASGTYGPNAVFKYGSSGFPTETYDSSNYWVDVIFASETSTVSTSTTTTPTTTTTPATSLLSVAPTSLSFGNITIGSSSTLPVVASDTGTGSVTISQATATGAGVSVNGPSLPLTLAAGQNTSFSVTFDPSTAGSVSGDLSVVSNASDSPSLVTLSATGANQHSVTLSWLASTSSGVVGYDVYRGTASGGPYTKVNSALVSGTTFTDTTVAAGQTYYYVATAVNSAGIQSAYSSQAAAVIPSP